MLQEIGDYILHNSVTEQYAQTGTMGYAKALGNMFGNFRKEYRTIAESHHMPINLVNGGQQSMENSTNNSDGSSVSTMSTITEKQWGDAKWSCNDVEGMARGLPTVNEGVKGNDELSLPSNELNYHAFVMTRTSVQEELESKARDGQIKQAEDANRARFGKGGEVIGKWTVCTLAMPMDRNEFTPKNLPVLVCGHNFYKKSNTICYRLCTENGILKGTYGREQLTPYPDISAASLGIDYNSLDKKQLHYADWGWGSVFQTGWKTKFLSVQEGLKQV
jgi:hypothetical protein